MSQSDDPPCLEEGMEISGKFNGAFCEAVIRRVDKRIKMKVKLEEEPFGTRFLLDTEIPEDSVIVLGGTIYPMIDDKEVRGTIIHIKDLSQYHVVFNDGDQKKLRRTQVVRQGAKHFAQGHSLDALPLTNPEHFSAPVKAPKRPSGGAQKTPRDPSQPSTSQAAEEESSDDEEMPSTSLEAVRMPSENEEPEEAPKEESKEERKQRRKEERKANEQREREQRARERMIRKRKLLKKQAIQECKDRRKDSIGKILMRHSRRFTMRTHKKRWRRRYKRLIRLEKWRIRNLRLHALYRDFTKRIGASKSCRFKRQWWKMSPQYRRSCHRAAKMLQDKHRVKEVRFYMKGLEKVKMRLHFVLVHADRNIGRKFLELIHKRNPEVKLQSTLAERRELEFEGMASIMHRHFTNVVWWPAVMFPDPVVDPETGVVKRKLRNIVTGEGYEMEERELVPLEWIPTIMPEDAGGILANVEQDIREKFKKAWRFAKQFTYHELDFSTIRIMLSLQRARHFHPHIPGRYAALNAKLSPLKPDPPQPSTSKQQPPEPEEYESDDAIRNATTEEKDRFLALLMQSHDSNNTILPAEPKIQGYDVDLFYLYMLAAQVGPPKKVYAAKPWEEWSRKLVPRAIDAGDELEALFRECLERFHSVRSKLHLPLLDSLVTNERKTFTPGQYSESRKKRQTALGIPDSSTRGTPSTRGGRGGGRGGRKRRTSLDSISEKKKGKQGEDSSRATTSSPGPSEVSAGPDVMDDQDDSSIATSDDRSFKKKKSQTPKTAVNRRGVGGGDEVVVVKKGRPRKYPLEPPRLPARAGRMPQKQRPADATDPNFCRANILTDFKFGQKLLLSHTMGWFNGSVKVPLPDNSEEVLNHMLTLQSSLNTINEQSVKEAVYRDLHNMFKDLDLQTHYTGWNARHDEKMKLQKIKVLLEDQSMSRKRFWKLPRGSELLPSTMAIVEKRFCMEMDTHEKPNYQRLAMEAYNARDDDVAVEEQDSDDDDEGSRRRRRSSSSSTDSSNGSPPPSNGRRRVELESSEDEEEKPIIEARRRTSSPDENSPEIGEKSTTPSSPESGISDVRKSRSGSEEIGVRSSKTPERPEEEKTEAKKEEEDEDVTSEETETDAEPEAAKPITPDSDYDVPEYPPTPQFADMENNSIPPVLQNHAVSLASSEGSSTHPILSPPHTSSAPMPAFPPADNIEHSGPLTLAEVPQSGPLETDEVRRRSNTNTSIERPTKRQRRASERSGPEDAALAAKRSTFTSQFSSGALTLDMVSQESSGPIVPMTVSKGAGRRRTASPPITRTGPLTASGPLTLASPTPVLVSNAVTPKQLGRPRKTATPAPPATTSPSKQVVPEDAKRNEPEPDEAEQAGPSTSQEPTSSLPPQEKKIKSPEAQEEEDEEAVSRERREQNASPRGRGGGVKRKRGGRGGFAPGRQAKPTVAKKTSPDDEMDEARSAAATPQTSATPTHHNIRGDGFIAQKNRMAAEMEADGSSHNYHELELDDIEMLLAKSPKDENLILEEKTAELREIFQQVKSDLSQLEKHHKRSIELAKKRAAKEREEAEALSESSSAEAAAEEA
ncbi:hypothetical protein L5515_007121 [Caenorhabditis briggsae]|uniref:ARID domain-containing protein n=3 Tax=Caenorhabditis briggsae TaxID=6238 RepID=A0AAE9F3A0_CAEBR|nr:hypothetical protein L5515_007121 [Caenorhabditis briggsae]